MIVSAAPQGGCGSGPAPRAMHPPAHAVRRFTSCKSQPRFAQTQVRLLCCTDWVHVNLRARNTAQHRHRTNGHGTSTARIPRIGTQPLDCGERLVPSQNHISELVAVGCPVAPQHPSSTHLDMVGTRALYRRAARASHKLQLDRAERRHERVARALLARVT